MIILILSTLQLVYLQYYCYNHNSSIISADFMLNNYTLLVKLNYMDTTSIILIIIFLTLIIIIGLIIFILVISAERKYKVRKLKENSSLFSPGPLRRRMQTYSDVVKNNKEIISIENKILDFEKRDFPKIQKLLKELSSFCEPKLFYKFSRFQILYKEMLNAIQLYEKDFLFTRFTLFDLTSEIEIENAIIKKLKYLTAKLNESIKNSPYEQIRNSKKLNIKISFVNNKIKKIKKEMDEQIKPLSEEFIFDVKKIENSIYIIKDNVESMNFYIKHLEEDLQITFKNIVKSCKDNQESLIEIDKVIKGMTKNINIIKNSIRVGLENISMKKVKEDSNKLDVLVNELYVLIHSNIDYYKFNNENDMLVDKLLKFVTENNGLFISEIRRYNVNGEKNRLININEYYDLFINSINKYEKEKMAHINESSPSRVNKKIMDSIYSYEKYIDIVEKNVKDISVVNSKTNDINIKLARMNTLLLQSELNINLLSTSLRDRFNVKKDELQLDVSKLRDNFKENIILPSGKLSEQIQILNKDINILVEETKGTAYEIFFIKESIMMLNAHRGLNPKYDEMMNLLSRSFYEEKITESLRRIKEIIEIYGIK